jgi:hypothetical protein
MENGCDRKAGHMRASEDLGERGMELERRLAQVRLSSVVVGAIIAGEGLGSVMDMALGGLEECLPADFASFWLSEPTPGDALVFVLGTRAQRTAPGIGLSLGAGASPKGSKGSGACSSVDDRVIGQIGEAGLRHMLAEPLPAEGRMEAFVICARMSGGAFQQQDRVFLKQIGMQLLLALRQKRLARDLEQASAELKRSVADESQQINPAFSKIVHDLNNALAPIFGYTDLMLDDDCLMPSKSKGYLMNIRAAARSISEIISRMRDFSVRPEERVMRSNS